VEWSGIINSVPSFSSLRLLSLIYDYITPFRRVLLSCTLCYTQAKCKQARRTAGAFDIVHIDLSGFCFSSPPPFLPSYICPPLPPSTSYLLSSPHTAALLVRTCTLSFVAHSLTPFFFAPSVDSAFARAINIPIAHTNPVARIPVQVLVAQ
jgi:hypothetical protein